MDILRVAHEADAIIAEAPIYYNCMAAQMITVINRLCCTFACKTYQIGLKKRVGIFLTCTGRKCLPSVFRIPPAMTGEIIWNGQKKSSVGHPKHRKCRVFCRCRRFSI